MLHKLEAGGKQVPYLIDFIWLLGMSEFQDVRESGKPEESHMNQLKEHKILKLFTFNNAEKKKTNKINQESLWFTLSRGLKQKSALLFP